MSSRKPDDESSFYVDDDSNDNVKTKSQFGNNVVETFGNYEDNQSAVGNNGDDDGIDESRSVSIPEAGTIQDKTRQEAVKIRIDDSVLCPLTGVAAFIQGGVVGGVVGLFSGISQTIGNGAAIEGGSIPKYLGYSIARSSWGFGVFMGTYSGTKCFMRTSRGRSDLLNTFAAGFAAGYVGSLHTRSQRTMLLSGAASGALMTVLDSIGHGPL